MVSARPASRPKRPSFQIVGGPKSGTTAMYQYLKEHPEVFMPELSELHFFGGDLNFDATHFVRDEKHYLSYFEGAEEDQLIGEKAVWYLYSKTAPKEIRAATPDCKIIIMLRNPVDMLHALHAQFLWDGNEDIEVFEQALRAEPDRRNGRRVPSSCYFLQGLFYRAVARYSEQVQRYLDILGRERVHIVLFDDLSQDAATEYRRTLRFLGVDPGFEPRFEVVNPNKEARSRLLHKAMHASMLRRTASGRLPFTVKQRVFMLGRRINGLNTAHRRRPPMDSALRHRLRTSFSDEIDALGRLIGRDLSSWGLEA